MTLLHAVIVSLYCIACRCHCSRWFAHISYNPPKDHCPFRGRQHWCFSLLYSALQRHHRTGHQTTARRRRYSYWLLFLPTKHIRLFTHSTGKPSNQLDWFWKSLWFCLWDICVLLRWNWNGAFSHIYSTRYICAWFKLAMCFCKSCLWRYWLIYQRLCRSCYAHCYWESC